MNFPQKQTIEDVLKKHAIRPSKRLGQNFLIDKNVLQKIIEAAKLKPTDIILEIGPGLGILTIELAKRVRKVIAVEKDRQLCTILKNILNAPNVKNVEIIEGDILKIESTFRLDRNESLTNYNYKIVANLPYYIVSPVMRKFLEAENPPQLLVLMVQKEVAQRIVANPPQMNLLAVAVQFYAQPKIISYVSKNSFWPRPKVDSAIIKIVPRKLSKDYSLRRTYRRPSGHGVPLRGTNEAEIEGSRLAGATDLILRANNSSIDTKLFFQLVKSGFSSKRKMLKNNLKIEKSILEKIGLDPKIRAENLSIEDWIKLSRVV